MTTGEYIKKIRLEKGLSQKELGEKLGVSQQMIGQWETGKTNPKLETIHKIADALNVPLFELMGFDGSIRVNLNPERERLNEEVQKIIVKQASGEEITEEEFQKVSDYIERTRESYDKLSKDVKNLTKVLGKYLNETTQISNEYCQILKEKILTLTDIMPAMPDFYENLNDTGRQKAVDYISDLSNIPEYRKEVKDEPPQE